eukprot:TRINITY_DN3608_c0_g1_i1.p1 TRINITY_DN3608_c0_g1~~TRINITY_DN3608_c0_g1_i1.p1  ORF type:complete len:464 (-),score=128.75 TRINITY_DN3608_c0_g1_i1:81-1370(-)
MKSINNAPFPTSGTKISQYGKVPKSGSLLHDPERPSRQEDHDSEVKNAEIIFNNIWNGLTKKFGAENLRFPKEIIWLMGAPGSGKTTNTPFIMKGRGISADPIVMSDLLNSPEAIKIKGEGTLVNDEMVVSILLEKLLDPVYQNGVVVDGFPRTEVQVECIKLMRDKMIELRKQYITTPHSLHFRRPAFRVCVLFVNQKESMGRQKARARDVLSNNAYVKELGHGDVIEPRATDVDDEKLEGRYRVFKRHFGILERLREHFTFTIVDASGSVQDVEKRIKKEFFYQSSLELGEETYDLVQTVPQVEDLVKNSRQALVRRLDQYQTFTPELFKQSIEIISTEFVPRLKRHTNSGHVFIRLRNDVLDKHEQTVDMIMDVLTERGYTISFDLKKISFAESVDRETFKVKYDSYNEFNFTVTFKKPDIRGWGE